MQLIEIWRYPVKSMAGERLRSAAVGAAGIPGDRRLVVVDGQGRLATSRRYPKLLGHLATTAPDGQVLIDGERWASSSIAAKVERAVGTGAMIVPVDERQGFDILPLLVATDGAVDSLGLDRRRFRPNLYLGGVPGLAERGWEGKTLAIGAARIRLDSLRGRCVMTTFDPDTLAQDPAVLRRIVQQMDGTLGLNAEVLEPGEIAEWDAAEIL
jgi:uncharacterized protein YcbX